MIPNFFTKLPILDITNSDLQEAINQVKTAKDQKDAVLKSLELINNRFKSYRFKTYTYFLLAFEKDPNKLWNRKNKFMHCHQQNFLLRVLLVKSGWFKDEDIVLKYSLVWHFSPHQWLKLKFSDGNEVAVDPWNQSFGAGWNQYASGFGFKSFKP